MVIQFDMNLIVMLVSRSLVVFLYHLIVILVSRALVVFSFLSIDLANLFTFLSN